MMIKQPPILLICALCVAVLTACGTTPSPTPPPAQPPPAPELPPPAPFELSVTLRDGFSPFAEIQYHIQIEPAPTLTVRRNYHGGFFNEQRVEVIGAETYQRFLTAVVHGCGGIDALASEVTEPPAREGVAVALGEVAVMVHPPGGEARTVVQRDPSRAQHPSWHCLLERTRVLTRQVAPLMPLQPRFVTNAARGLVDLVTEPPQAEIYIDGIALGLVTPQWRVPMLEGQHTVRFVLPNRDLDQSYEFRVVRGQRTIFEVELR